MGAKKKSDGGCCNRGGCCGVLCCACPCIKYSHLLHLDLSTLICHAFAAFVLYNRNMLFPIVTVRLPRLIMSLLNTFWLRKNEGKVTIHKIKYTCCEKSILCIEAWFRAISAICMLGFSVFIQF